MISKRQVHEPQELVHTDICGKKVRSQEFLVYLCGAEYFKTFTDEKETLFMGLFLDKHQAFDSFQEMKAMVEKVSGKTLKTLQSNNGSEYISKTFEVYLKSDGVRHERTIPKTSQQNGVAEKLTYRGYLHTLMFLFFRHFTTHVSTFG